MPIIEIMQNGLVISTIRLKSFRAAKLVDGKNGLRERQCMIYARGVIGLIEGELRYNIQKQRDVVGISELIANYDYEADS